MDIIGIFCGVIFALMSFGLLAIIALFISCDLAAEEEKKQGLKNKKNL
jgi:hypothetical protein